MYIYIHQTMVYVVDGHPCHVESEIMGIYYMAHLTGSEVDGCKWAAMYYNVRFDKGQKRHFVGG